MTALMCMSLKSGAAASKHLEPVGGLANAVGGPRRMVGVDNIEACRVACR
jgi:hypothetical protein